ncbi:hypothetical protein R3P38DRAFT_2889445 [Favolaschia claudopus]|uniref:ATP synthase CF0 subunit I n=1 Tax=Favolaschia claudopus TaxID=2862362 RepID=A0AAW0CUZ8_9AGAR
MPDLVVQLLPLALTPLAGLIPGQYPAFIRLQKLEKEIDRTLEIHAMAVRDLRVTQVRMKFGAKESNCGESVLRAKVLGGGDVAWRGYPQYLRGLSIHIGGCQRDARKVGALMMATEDIAQRQTLLETVFLKSIQGGREFGRICD